MSTPFKPENVRSASWPIRQGNICTQWARHLLHGTPSEEATTSHTTSIIRTAMQ